MSDAYPIRCGSVIPMRSAANVVFNNAELEFTQQGPGEEMHGCLQWLRQAEAGAAAHSAAADAEAFCRAHARRSPASEGAATGAFGLG